MSDNKGIKASTSQAAVLVRRKLFAERYLTNGRNATEAAIHVGYAEANAAKAGFRLLQYPDVQTLIAARTEQVVAKAILTTDKWAQEIAGIGHFDPGEMYDENGDLIPIHKMPVHVRKAIGSIKHSTRRDGKGEDAAYITTTEVKAWDKNAALANIGRHLGVFEKDNRQQVTAIQVNLRLVG